MFIVTNRMVNEQGKTPSEIFGEKPAEGPNELRLAEARRQGKQWQLDLLPDQITAEMAASVGLDPDLPHPASAYVARKLLERCAGTGSTAKQKLKTGKHLLLFVHGFNNDLDDVLERAAGLEARYGVEVLCFSWPANGGGARGVLSYKSDKRDALASAGALDRVLEKMKGLLDEFNGQYVTQLEEKAQKKFADNGEAWDRYFAKEVNKRCPFTINLLLHSMGNYLFKHLLSSTTYHANQLLFDNIIMAAADTNNELHAQWVDRIQCRNRLYITINERDGALMASRMKMGEQQKARLGHYTRRHRRARGAVRCGPEPLSPLATAQKNHRPEQGGGFSLCAHLVATRPPGASVLPLPAGALRCAPVAVHRPWPAICPGPVFAPGTRIPGAWCRFFGQVFPSGCLLTSRVTHWLTALFGQPAHPIGHQVFPNCPTK
ncbi:alpha/beta hydrolase [Aeromonas caviae]|uniref:alpha/beta hydrolase n=2 Tax=Aeromonas caviae TaxID=648 RepID=UPI0038D1F1C3